MKYALLLLVSLVLLGQSYGQDSKYKALFIYKFVRYMDWPPEKTSDGYTIAVLGDEEVIDEIQKLTSNRSINGKMIQVLAYSSELPMNDINLLFIAKDMSDRFSTLSSEAISNSVLLVTESPGLCKKGSTVNFNNDYSSLRYEMNLSRLELTKIRASSTITSSAILVN